MTPTRIIATLAAALIVIQPALARAQAQTAAAVTPAQSSTPPRSLFWDDFRRGWHFYEEPEPEALPPPPAKPMPPRPEAKRQDSRAP